MTDICHLLSLNATKHWEIYSIVFWPTMQTDSKHLSSLWLCNRSGSLLLAERTLSLSWFRWLTYVFTLTPSSRVIRRICHTVDMSLQQRKFLNNFRTSELPQLSSKLEKLLNLLVIYLLNHFIRQGLIIVAMVVSPQNTLFSCRKVIMKTLIPLGHKSSM